MTIPAPNCPVCGANASAPCAYPEGIKGCTNPHAAAMPLSAADIENILSGRGLTPGDPP